ncbi:MAG: MFS transporter [Salibacteraceae bacterium]
MKNRRSLILLIAAHIVSAIAQGISMLAIPWYFTSVLQEASLFGTIYAGVTLFTILWSIYAGSLIDKYPRKNLFLAITAVGCLVVGGISSVGFITGTIPTFLVAGVFCLTICNYQMHYPALYAFSQELTDKSNYGRINSILEVQGQSTNMISGGFAALLFTGINQEVLQAWGLEWISIEVAPWSLHEIFLMDAVTYAVAFGLILAIRYTPAKSGSTAIEPAWQRLKEGFRFLRERVPLFVFGNFAYSIFAIVLVEIFMLLPLYIDNQLEKGPAIYALARFVFSMGSLLAGVFIRWVFRRFNYIAGILSLMAFSTIWFFVLSATNSLLLFALFNFFVGFANAGTRVLRVTYLFHQIPNHIIGRTSGVFQMINILLRFGFISLFALSFFSEENNVVYAYSIAGAFILLSTIPLLVYYKKLTSRRGEGNSAN